MIIIMRMMNTTDEILTKLDHEYDNGYGFDDDDDDRMELGANDI